MAVVRTESCAYELHYPTVGRRGADGADGADAAACCCASQVFSGFPRWH